MTQKSILIVDDSQTVRHTLATLCFGLGLEMDAASNAEEALVLFKRNHHDFILTDYALPAGSGLELVQAARQISPDVPCLIITGYPDDRVRGFSMETPNCRFMVKPLRLIEITHVLISQLQIHSDSQPVLKTRLPA